MTASFSLTGGCPTGQEVAALADRLGIDRFSVPGYSEGGPHAAVCAARLPGRVASAALVSSLASFALPGMTDGLVPNNVRFLRLALDRPWLYLRCGRLVARSAAGHRPCHRPLGLRPRRGPGVGPALARRPRSKRVAGDLPPPCRVHPEQPGQTPACGGPYLADRQPRIGDPRRARARRQAVGIPAVGRMTALHAQTHEDACRESEKGPSGTCGRSQ